MWPSEITLAKALHVSIRTASEACFELLLPVSDVDARTVPGSYDPGREGDQTALHLACHFGQLPMCKALLSHGADPMVQDSWRWTALHWAAGGGSSACVTQLVGRPGRFRMTPAEVDTADDTGATALHIAAGRGLDQICAVLLGAGASLDAEEADGGTPLMNARHFATANAALIAPLSGDKPAQLPGSTCDRCGKMAEQATRGTAVCCACQDAYYCCEECQLAARPGHKAACKARAKEREVKARATVARG